MEGIPTTDYLAVARQVSDISLPGLIVLALYASFKGWWVWGHQLTELKADYEQRLTKSEAANAKWEDMALRAAGLAEHGLGLAKKSSE